MSANIAEMEKRRAAARMGWNEQIANHNSLMLPRRPDETPTFLINPRGWRFDELAPPELDGVDGPVLHWAVRRARGSEPIVWVTDGQVTDSNDHPCHSLSVECAQLVRRHRIRMARDLTEAHLALRGRRFAAQRFGRVGQALSE